MAIWGVFRLPRPTRQLTTSPVWPSVAIDGLKWLQGRHSCGHRRASHPPRPSAPGAPVAARARPRATRSEFQPARKLSIADRSTGSHCRTRMAPHNLPPARRHRFRQGRARSPAQLDDEHVGAVLARAHGSERLRTRAARARWGRPASAASGRARTTAIPDQCRREADTRANAWSSSEASVWCARAHTSASRRWACDCVAGPVAASVLARAFPTCLQARAPGASCGPAELTGQVVGPASGAGIAWPARGVRDMNPISPSLPF